tara:strand:- start:171 stop:479 length:309 start_codon:yes stop_codon:yes gene_type:complete
MKLTKTVYQSQIATDNTSLDRSFVEMKKIEDKISVNKFFQYYEKLFLLIPKTGGNSHSTLFKKSGSYIDKVTENKDRKINVLQNKIIELEFQISQLDITNNS